MPYMDTKTGLKLEDNERQRCEVWTRVIGYYRPVSEFNIGKKQETKERKMFKLTKEMLS